MDEKKINIIKETRDWVRSTVESISITINAAFKKMDEALKRLLIKRNKD